MPRQQMPDSGGQPPGPRRKLGLLLGFGACFGSAEQEAEDKYRVSSARRRSSAPGAAARSSAPSEQPAAVTTAGRTRGLSCFPLRRTATAAPPASPSKTSPVTPPPLPNKPRGRGATTAAAHPPVFFTPPGTFPNPHDRIARNSATRRLSFGPDDNEAWFGSPPSRRPSSVSSARSSFRAGLPPMPRGPSGSEEYPSVDFVRSQSAAAGGGEGAQQGLATAGGAGGGGLRAGGSGRQAHLSPSAARSVQLCAPCPPESGRLRPARALRALPPPALTPTAQFTPSHALQPLLCALAKQWHFTD